jgi:hypothetical protein
VSVVSALNRSGERRVPRVCGRAVRLRLELGMGRCDGMVMT